MSDDPVLTRTQREFLAAARRAVLATIDPDGRPRLVPICFVLDNARPILYSPLDEKPKVVRDPRGLARVRDVLRDPRVTLLVDRWDEAWDRLAWLRCHGLASMLEPVGGPADEHAIAVVALRRKYPQYRTQDLPGRPILRIEIERATSWAAANPATG
jgi:PPOX class probable F420-dependent enzyme